MNTDAQVLKLIGHRISIHIRGGVGGLKPDIPDLERNEVELSHLSFQMSLYRGNIWSGLD